MLEYMHLTGTACQCVVTTWQAVFKFPLLLLPLLPRCKFLVNQSYSRLGHSPEREHNF